MPKDEAKEQPGVIAATGTKRNRLVAQLSEYNGERLLNLRRWYLDKKTNEWMPTKKGLSLTARGYTFLTSVIQEYRVSILDWFGLIGEEGSSGSSAVARAGGTVEASLTGPMLHKTAIKQLGLTRLHELTVPRAAVPYRPFHLAPSSPPAEFDVVPAEWASPEAFVVIHEGGAATLRVNAGTELGRRVLEEYDENEESKGRHESGVGLLLSYVVAQSQAKALFDGQDEFEAAELFDLHSWNVGLLVNRMVRRDG